MTGAELGVGIGWRPEIAGFVESLPGLRFVEVVAEGLAATGSDGLPPSLARLRARGVTVVPHGTRLSLGGAEPVDPARVGQLRRAAELTAAPLVSEHIAFVRAGGTEAGHLLPLPRTRAAVAAVARNVARVRAEVEQPLALEPIAAFLDWPDDELTEAEFVTAVLDATGCPLLLDVANVYANAVNRGLDPATELHRFPLDRIAYVHVAGGAAGADDGIYHDTHTEAVPPPVLALLAELTRRARPSGLLLERDGNYPPAARLAAELDAIADACGRPRVTR